MSTYNKQFKSQVKRKLHAIEKLVSFFEQETQARRERQDIDYKDFQLLSEKGHPATDLFNDIQEQGNEIQATESIAIYLQAALDRGNAQFNKKGGKQNENR